MKYQLEKSPKYKDQQDIPVFQIKAKEQAPSRNYYSWKGTSTDTYDGKKYLISLEYLDYKYEIKRWQTAHRMEKGAKEVAELLVPIEAVFGCYDMEKESVKTKLVVIDTLQFQHEGDINEGLSNVPSRQEAYDEAVYQVVSTFVSKICSTWQWERRDVYSDGTTDFEQARWYLENYEWKKAIATWLYYVDDENPQKALIACLNTALACEMMGNLALATEWFEIAKKKNTFNFYLDYQYVLYSRYSYERQLEEKQEGVID